MGKLLWKMATILTACQIDPSAKMQGGIGLPHATGIVIGGQTIVEGGAVIYQNVTIGRQHPLEPEAPYIMAEAIIGAGATVLGNITVGRGAKIGANSVVLFDVPDRALAVGVPANIRCRG
jgi:serine O-acetyltransferase